MDWPGVLLPSDTLPVHPKTGSSFSELCRETPSLGPGACFHGQFWQWVTDTRLDCPLVKPAHQELFLRPLVAVREEVCHKHRDVRLEAKQPKVSCWGLRVKP